MQPLCTGQQSPRPLFPTAVKRTISSGSGFQHQIPVQPLSTQHLGVASSTGPHPGVDSRKAGRGAVLSCAAHPLAAPWALQNAAAGRGWRRSPATQDHTDAHRPPRQPEAIAGRHSRGLRGSSSPATAQTLRRTVFTRFLPTPQAGCVPAKDQPEPGTCTEYSYTLLGVTLRKPRKVTCVHNCHRAD